MPAKKLLSKNEGFMKAWELYTSEGILKRELLRDIIADSWLRCERKGVDPYKPNKGKELTKKELKEKYEKYNFLLTTAKPFMNTLYKIVGNTGLIVRLTDSEGYVLELSGDKKLIKHQAHHNMHKGCNVREEIIGTNAIGTALITKKPIQVLGGEHYCKEYHDWTTSACPIKDKKGKTIGVLSMSGPCKKVHPHTLGMVHASAEAIENEMKLGFMNRRLKMANQHYHAIVESITEGLVSVDKKGIIRGINQFACRILNYEEEEIQEKNIKCILHKEHSDKIMNVIRNGKKYEEEEVYFKTKKGRKITCIINITPIKDKCNDNVEGAVFTFREAKVVHNLVNKIVGAEARFNFDDILGESIEINKAKKIAAQAAKTNTTVLLLGESGTGKEMFAQAIHNESKRKSKPFVFLNCGAIPRELVASELFGYVEGAFTGAKRGGHPGKFELADGGTIFLDEIGDMPLDTQSNLLRVLETKEIVRIGGHDVIPVDVRVIAATHKDIKEEVDKGNFRSDLFYRLNVMPIHTPSLRERKEDIKILIDYFLEKFQIKMGKKVKGIDKSFYRGMMSYDWPGNVRELQNVMQLVINLANENKPLNYEHLPKHMKSNPNAKDLNITDDLLSLDEIEKISILKTIQKVDGNMALAAKILGIGRSTLYRKIDKYDLRYVLK
ncbi:MAG: PAS domain S-box protein [Firmicutes bacterium]|nr:PAS domain S-box protein [Bacillota bacterium]